MQLVSRQRWIWLAALACGCVSTRLHQQNPTAVLEANYEVVWNKTVAVLDQYFDIGYENRYSGQIETLPQTGATLFEPWRFDAVDFSERLEGTLQTIRRRAFALVQPAPNGGFLITIEVYKELEDLNQPIFASFGGGTFISSHQPIREALVTSAIKATDGWISLGRDDKLEARILDEIDACLNGQTY